mmetsp:Transcript_10354/g.20390  ORF Transcript_10354/g.20390 Transcript_10354/m.20390 type:complete len:554 (+) Transcript_10354:362-2023(+)|eukprot:CAMPEP_0171570308 /NCGR_PEP_ID=MMETSP0961-20121227/2872_1 /TAXON_ID=87120 /ORGANISM="Aurantiochytrium limacinum, Strain ATCCMYA-1381" /LENGTH=553 /DNA_ID=CAMNT_0012124783 /DNA_START=356 /DNA_END=2017 /DNA_ORIENTATION=-
MDSPLHPGSTSGASAPSLRSLGSTSPRWILSEREVCQRSSVFSRDLVHQGLHQGSQTRNPAGNGPLASMPLPSDTNNQNKRSGFLLGRFSSTASSSEDDENMDLTGEAEMAANIGQSHPSSPQQQLSQDQQQHHSHHHHNHHHHHHHVQHLHDDDQLHSHHHQQQQQRQRQQQQFNQHLTHHDSQNHSRHILQSQQSAQTLQNSSDGGSMERRKQLELAFAKHRFDKDIADLIESRVPYFLPHAHVSFCMYETPTSELKSKIHKTLVCCIRPLDGAYQDASWRFRVDLLESYPFQPPRIKSLTPLFHPNIHPDTGVVALPILENDWSPVCTLQIVVLGLVLLFVEPNLEHVVNTEAAELLHISPAQFLNRVAQNKAQARELVSHDGNGDLPKRPKRRPSQGFPGTEESTHGLAKRRFIFQDTQSNASRPSITRQQQTTRDESSDIHRSAGNSSYLSSQALRSNSHQDGHNVLHENPGGFSESGSAAAHHCSTDCYESSTGKFHSLENTARQDAHVTKQQSVQHCSNHNQQQRILVQKLTHCSLSQSSKRRKMY